MIRLISGLYMAISTGTVVSLIFLVNVSKRAAAISWFICFLVGMYLNPFDPSEKKKDALYLRVQSGTVVTAILGWIIICILRTYTSKEVTLLGCAICFLIGMYFDPVGKKDAKERKNPSRDSGRYHNSSYRYRDSLDDDPWLGYSVNEKYSIDYSRIDGYNDNGGDDGDY